MGNKFTLVLNREITDDELQTLRDAGVDAVVGRETSRGADDVKVTKLDFDTDVWPSLTEAIQSSLDAVTAIPELSVPTLTVPAQQVGDPAVVAGDLVGSDPVAVGAE
ncbi:hypothetical protein [Jidongwangia harbinensis]|uniref:hypothetical protein n=1 Tax=Jidongwangia harbinensis TaxID=2878561 RepID=UPI001CD97423|nr:hypothetical protein [Jidongwangia harbinensis]MCA2217184.1 hypothetical protein [Jidongwangia harbinensis]